MRSKKTDSSAQPDYKEKIKAALFPFFSERGLILDESLFFKITYEQKTDQEIDLDALYLKLKASKSLGEKIVSSNENGKIQFIQFSSKGSRHLDLKRSVCDYAYYAITFSLVACTSINEDPIRALLLLGEFGDIQDLRLHLKEIQRAFAEKKLSPEEIERTQDAFQKTIVLRKDIPLALYLYHNFALRLPVDIVVSAASANDYDLLEFLWRHFFYARKECFSLLDLCILCTDGCNEVLRFLRDKKEDFEKEGISINAGPVSERPILWALRSEHPNSNYIVGEFFRHDVQANDCLEASNIDKFKWALKVCPPTFDTLILAILNNLKKSTKLSRDKIYELMNTISFSFNDYLNHLEWHGLRRFIFLGYINGFRETKGAQHFLYECIFLEPLTLRLMGNLDDLNAFIIKHREQIIYTPFIQNMVDRTQNPFDSQHAYNQYIRLDIFLDPNSYSSAGFQKAHEFLFSSWSPLPDRLKAHYYLVLIVLEGHLDIGPLPPEAKNLSSKIYYAALKERVDRIHNLEYQLLWFDAALKSGLFTEDFCKKMSEEIYRLRPRRLPHAGYGLFRTAAEKSLPQTHFEWKPSNEEEEAPNSNPFFQKCKYVEEGKELQAPRPK